MRRSDGRLSLTGGGRRQGKRGQRGQPRARTLGFSSQTGVTNGGKLAIGKNSVPPRRRTNWKREFRWGQPPVAARHSFDTRPSQIDRQHYDAQVIPQKRALIQRAACTAVWQSFCSENWRRWAASNELFGPHSDACIVYVRAGEVLGRVSRCAAARCSQSSPAATQQASPLNPAFAY